MQGVPRSIASVSLLGKEQNNPFGGVEQALLQAKAKLSSLQGTADMV